MEEYSSKFNYSKPKVIVSFLMTLATVLTLTTFVTMVNFSEVDAATVISPTCNVINQDPDGECSVDIDYDGNCSPSTSDCNIAVNINKNPGGGSVNFNPDPNNELKLNYLLETGLECNNVKSSWGKARCLTASNNDYVSNTRINTDGLFGTFDNEINSEGSQQIRDTEGQALFTAKNNMRQDVSLFTRDRGSTIHTDGTGDNLILKYNQDIVGPDNSDNNNKGTQLVNLQARTGGAINTYNHEETGFSLNQELIGNDDTDGQTGQVKATNEGRQSLFADARTGATIEYDTLGLSELSQVIQDCEFGVATCINQAGSTTSGSTTLPDGTLVPGSGGMQVALDARGTGTVIDVDDLQQYVSQNIDNFDTSAGKTAKNDAPSQLFSAVARAGGEIDMDTGESSSQSLSQSIIDSRATSTNTVGLQELKVGVGTVPVEGLVEANVDQRLYQQISASNVGTSSNLGTMTITLLSKDGPSKLFIDGFDQYLTQTTSCNNCNNNGQVISVFEVEDAATFRLLDGSVQGLSQVLTQNGESNTNVVSSQISVSGTGTANVGLDHQISNFNGDNDGNSMFTATYSGPGTVTEQCTISETGVYTRATSCS